VAREKEKGEKKAEKEGQVKEKIAKPETDAQGQKENDGKLQKEISAMQEKNVKEHDSKEKYVKLPKPKG
jgi:hypothetical protein